MTPYIPTDETVNEMPRTRGQLANCLSETIAEYVSLGPLSFAAISDVRGAVLAALNEFERRVAEPYEQSKIEGGGDDPYAALEQQACEALANARHSRTIEQLRRG